VRAPGIDAETTEEPPRDIRPRAGSLPGVPPAPEPAVRASLVTAIDDRIRAQLADLLDAAQRVDDFPGLSDQARIDLEGDRLEVGFAVLARAGDPDGVAALSAASRRTGTWSVETVVHPDVRADPHVLHQLVAMTLDEVAARGGGPVRAWVRAAPEDAVDELAPLGLRPARTLLQLRAPLQGGGAPPAPTRPLPVRPFRPGRDERAWLAVNARAFAGHPEQGTWTLADLERRERAPWFDPEGFLLHEAEGRLAGFCWTKVHAASEDTAPVRTAPEDTAPALGEIYVIGVDPDFQGRGLGRALTLAGLDHLARRGVPTAMLYVEADNAPALALYGSLGFTEHHREVQYAGTVKARAQVDAPTARPTP